MDVESVRNKDSFALGKDTAEGYTAITRGFSQVYRLVGFPLQEFQGPPVLIDFGSRPLEA